MSAVTLLGSATWNTTGGDTTVTATPSAGDLIVIVAGTSGLSGGTTAVSDNNFLTVGYTQVDADRTGFSTTGVLTVWVRNGLIAKAASTVFTASQGGSTGGGLAVMAVTLMKRAGAGAVRSNGGQSTGTAGTAPAPVLNQAALTGNCLISAVANGTNTAGVTARTSPAWTRDVDAGYNSPATGLDVAHINSGETGTTLTWGSTSASAFASMAIELNTTDPAVPYSWVGDSAAANRTMNDLQQMAVGRAATR